MQFVPYTGIDHVVLPPSVAVERDGEVIDNDKPPILALGSESGAYFADVRVGGKMYSLLSSREEDPAREAFETARRMLEDGGKVVLTSPSGCAIGGNMTYIEFTDATR